MSYVDMDGDSKVVKLAIAIAQINDGPKVEITQEANDNKVDLTLEDDSNPFDCGITKIGYDECIDYADDEGEYINNIILLTNNCKKGGYIAVSFPGNSD
jgi:hypothetical protein